MSQRDSVANCHAALLNCHIWRRSKCSTSRHRAREYCTQGAIPTALISKTALFRNDVRKAERADIELDGKITPKITKMTLPVWDFHLKSDVSR